MSLTVDINDVRHEEVIFVRNAREAAFSRRQDSHRSSDSFPEGFHSSTDKDAPLQRRQGEIVGSCFLEMRLRWFFKVFGGLFHVFWGLRLEKLSEKARKHLKKARK